MMNLMMKAMPELRYQSTLKRVRARLGDTVVVDTTAAMLIFEPLRVVPSYAAPEADIHATVRATPSVPPPEYQSVGFGRDYTGLLDPSVPFAVHTSDGEPVRIEANGESASGFRLADPDLSRYVVLDFADFDWWEENEPIISHPRDPYHRIDVRRSSRQIRIEHGGIVLAETDRARMLFEGAFPLARYYIPIEDVRVELRPGTLLTACAYKGQATHYTVAVGDQELRDIAWTYEAPLSDAADVTGLISFYQERLDLVVDGEPVERVLTPWS